MSQYPSIRYTERLARDPGESGIVHLSHTRGGRAKRGAPAIRRVRSQQGRCVVRPAHRHCRVVDCASRGVQGL